MGHAQRSPAEVAATLERWVIYRTFEVVAVLRMGKLLGEMGPVPDTFAYDNLISTATETLLEEAP